MIFGLAIPTLPELQRLYSGRPVYGADLAAFATVEGHLAGLRLRRVASAIFECRADTMSGSVLAIPDLPPGPVAGPVTHRLYCRVSPSATLLWVSVDYQASDEYSVEPVLDIELHSLAGVVYDAGVRFRFNDGTLPAAEVANPSILAGSHYPIQTVHCGGREPSTADLAAAPSQPRLLSLASVPAGGGRAQLVFTATGVRLLSATAWEWPGVEV